MESVGDGSVLFRVERGRASDVELAAVAVTLMSLAAGRPRDGGRAPRGPGRTAAWRPREFAAAYRAPHSWR
ncbi:acyl-CoA carboxylase subunit epsilon [Streptomyces sp. NPDC020607]|uniref:acyl-CoA carboxylase subunit epsilon n=1 Tax=Streptomyces sp. NPDC020607 TaxID=3365082 RepID=UPI0037AC0F26